MAEDNLLDSLKSVKFTEDIPKSTEWYIIQKAWIDPDDDTDCLLVQGTFLNILLWKLPTSVIYRSFNEDFDTQSSKKRIL